MLNLFIVAFIIIGLYIASRYAKKVEDTCDKRKSLKSPCAPISEDEIRRTAYLLAADDNFSKSPDVYWHAAEKKLRGN